MGAGRYINIGITQRLTQVFYGDKCEERAKRREERDGKVSGMARSEGNGEERGERSERRRGVSGEK